MRCRQPITGTGLCQQCGGTIAEGRLRNQPPTEARYCLKCRSDRRRRPNLKYVWRSEYDDYLKAHYYGGLNRRFQVLNRMIRETGLPRWYIKKRAASLGLTMHQDKRPWTAEEEESLERLLGKVSALTIARRLKRTDRGVSGAEDQAPRGINAGSQWLHDARSGNLPGRGPPQDSAMGCRRLVARPTAGHPPARR